MSSSSQFCTVMLLKPHRDYFGALEGVMNL
jgi:hypothetical protein